MTAEGSRPEPTVHVIDDDEAVQRAVAMLLRSAGIKAQIYPSGLAFLDALASFGDNSASCVLTDVRMPELDGFELMDRLKEQGFRGPVVAMTAHGDVATAVRAMKAGATDFIEKPFDDEAFLAAISAALGRANAPGAAGVGAEAAVRIAALSPREREVLELLITGKSNKAVARELGLSPRTVEVHRARLMTRLAVANFAEAVRLAVWAELDQARHQDRNAQH
jgi:two-component system, LuxR family, response regulator FixJ